MRARTWGPAAAAVLLVVGVVAIRDGTAAAPVDLRPPVVAEEIPPAPSPAPSRRPGDPVLLTADGLPGARLGTQGEGLHSVLGDAAQDAPGVGADGPRGGCDPLWLDGTTEGWSTTAWRVDGVVSSVIVSGWDPSVPPAPALGTWLGPTLGSPVTSASSLPGARTSTERPFGEEGPSVTVVHVPVGTGGTGEERGPVEVVYSDAFYDMALRDDGTAGLIMTIEVRHPRARGCSMEAFSGPTPTPAGVAPLVIGPDGLTVAPLGTAEPALAGLGLQAEDVDPGGAGCRAFGAGTDDGYARVLAVDGVVVQAETWGTVTSELPVAAGDSLDAVRLAFPDQADQLDPVRAADGQVDLSLGDRVLQVRMWPEDRWVPDVEASVLGGPPLVQGLTVRDVTADPTAMC